LISLFHFQSVSQKEQMSVLVDNQYGKSRVRLVRVDRSQPDQHVVFEITANTYLRGDFAGTYLTGDNSQVVPTDTQKNTVYYLAKLHLNGNTCLEEFGLAIVKHFLAEHKQISQASVDLWQHRWVRIIDPKTNAPHRNAFVRESPELRTTVVTATRNGSVSITSGIKGLTVLKTSGSGFEGFPRCKLTTLPEARDRMLSTNVQANWTFSKKAISEGKINFCDVHNGVRNIFLDTFANYYSNSVQQVIYDAGTAVVAKFPTVDEIKFVLPNIHINLYDIGRFGLDNKDEVYFPIDEPAGYIEGTVGRKIAAKM